MTNTAWESLSNQAIGAAGIVYFLALLVFLAEWAGLRQVVHAGAAASTAIRQESSTASAAAE